jgi:cell division protein FtsB
VRYWESSKSKRRARSKATAEPKRAVALGGSLKEYPFLRKFYQHRVVISGGLQRFLFFLIIATLLYAFVFGEAGAIRILTLANERDRLEQDIALLEQDIDAITGQIDRLKNDPLMMEKLGRERYRYIYPGERVYKLLYPPKRN